MLLNCGVEKTIESPLDCKEIQPIHPRRNQSWIFIHWKDWCWSWNSNTLATWCEELTHLKRPWCWERLRAGEGDDRGWEGWMASPTQWTWVWVNSGSWRWTGRPGMLRFIGSQRIGYDWTTELNWTILHSATWWFPSAITAGQQKPRGRGTSSNERKQSFEDHCMKEIKWLIEKNSSFCGMAINSRVVWMQSKDWFCRD